MMSDSYVLDAGWVFFAACGVIVAAVSVAAFGRDLLPSKLLSKPHDESAAPRAAATGQPASRLQQR